MTKISCLLFFPVFLLFTSCFAPQQAFYLSPRHANSNNYKAHPMQSDSIRSALYASVLISGGAANSDLKDDNFQFQGNMHKSLQWKGFQAFLGAGFSLGFYDVTPYTFGGNDVDTDWINEREGEKFHGSYGIQGGINYVRSFGHAEWRVIGIEANMQNEYGAYHRFRKELPEGAVNIVDRSRMYNNFSVYTDIMRRFSDESVIGYRLGYSHSFRKLSGRISNFPITGIPRYVTHTIHITVNKWTGYGQVNFGSDAFSIQYGMSRRINAKKIVAKSVIN